MKMEIFLAHVLSLWFFGFIILYNLLNKRLPVMFVPGLVMLPLAPSVGSPVEVRAPSLRGCIYVNYRIFPCSLQLWFMPNYTLGLRLNALNYRF